jgi:hypothetical protein
VGSSAIYELGLWQTRAIIARCLMAPLSSWIAAITLWAAGMRTVSKIYSAQCRFGFFYQVFSGENDFTSDDLPLSDGMKRRAG